MRTDNIRLTGQRASSIDKQRVTPALDIEEQVCNQARYLGVLVAYVGKKPRERDLCGLHTGHGSDF